MIYEGLEFLVLFLFNSRKDNAWNTLTTKQRLCDIVDIVRDCYTGGRNLISPAAIHLTSERTFARVNPCLVREIGQFKALTGH